ncbi:MAG: insulinase family protein [Oscillospiraceae bacterium]|nr:insulinase family protein [Oscillospiraceae bacterium]
MYQYRTLRNGIKVVAEKINYLKSISIGVWIGNGSRYENADVNGISHFIEHMLFKGTEKRSAAQIAGEIDAIGGQIDAFTSREYTCFCTKTLDYHADIALDILSDMLFNPRLNKDDMALERQVIGEEIRMYEDSPEDLVYDLSSYAIWGDTPMGRPILGTYESLDRITPEAMRGYMNSHYTGANTIISVAGNFDDNLFDLLEEYFGSHSLVTSKPQMPEAKYLSGNNMIRRKDIEQVQLVASFKGIDVMDESVYSLLVFNNVFGSGMSSRLFQNVRENRGLVYSISAGHSAYIGTGAFDISAGMSVKSLREVAKLVSEEINIIKRDKLTESEINTAKEQLKGSYILSSESTGARMQGAGRSLLLGKPIYTQEETLKKIDAVNSDSVAEIIDRVLDSSTLSVSAVGPLDSVENLFDLE